MTKTLSSSEVQNNFGAVLQWAEEHQDDVVVERRGKPAGVLIAYEQYQEFLRLKEEERRRKALAALEALRREVLRRNPAITAEEAYRAAGFSDEVVDETLASDEELRGRSA
jgi:prevent-host-death family protein